MSSLKVTQITPRHLRGTTFIGENGSTTHFHPHSRVILHEYATKEWILEMLGDLDGADLSELVTKKYAHATFGEIFIGKQEPLNVKESDLWFDTKDQEQHLKMCDRVDRDVDGNVIGYNWINVAPRPSVDDDVVKLKEDVVVLQGEIESLITLDEKGSWVSTSTNPPETGKVHFSTSDFTASEITATISLNDKDGTNHKFTNVGVGTWIEFVEDDADYCLGQIKDIGDAGNNHFQATFDVSVGKGTTNQDSVVKIRAFEAVDDFDPNSIRIVDITTAPPANPNDGDLWYDNTEDTMQLQVYHHDSDAWIAAAPPSTLDSRVSAGEALQAQIGEAVVDLQSDKLTKSGDDMHGSYYATQGRHLRFYGKDNSNRNKTFIDLVNTNGEGTEGTDFYLKLYHVATPTAPYHGANQKYVDDSISALTIPDATELLTEDEIRNIVKSHGGTPILWKYNSSVPADSLGNGEFNLSSGLSNGSAGEWSIYFANRDARGQRWFPHDSGNEYTHEVGDQMATIRERDAIICHGKTTKWYFNQGSNNYVRLKLTYYRNQFAMSSGKWYLMNIPGYMPFFTYSSNSYSNGTH